MLQTLSVPTEARSLDELIFQPSQREEKKNMFPSPISNRQNASNVKMRAVAYIFRAARAQDHFGAGYPAVPHLRLRDVRDVVGVLREKVEEGDGRPVGGVCVRCHRAEEHIPFPPQLAFSPNLKYRASSTCYHTSHPCARTDEKKRTSSAVAHALP